MLRDGSKHRAGQGKLDGLFFGRTVWKPSVLVFGLLLAVALLGALPTAFSSSAQSPDIFEQSFDFGPDSTVQVDNPGGKIAVEVWGEELVHVVASRRNGNPGALASDVAFMRTRSKMSVVCQKSGEEIDLKIYVPRRSNLRLNSVAGAIEILGPVAGATVETQAGDILWEAPSSQDAYVSIFSAQGAIKSDLNFGAYDVNTPNNLQGKLGDGGAPVFLRTRSGMVSVQPLRPQLAMLTSRGPSNPALAAATQPDYGSTTAPYRPDPGSNPNRSPNSNNSGGTQAYDDVFGVDQNSQGSTTQANQQGNRNQTLDSNGGTNGGLRVKVTPPPSSPAPRNTPAADDVLGKDDSTSGNSGNSGTRQGNGDKTDVFGVDQDTQGSSSRRDSGGLGNRSRRDDSNGGTSGGFGVRIIPPPTSPAPQNTPAADDVLTDRNSNPNGSNGNRSGSLRGRAPSNDDVASSTSPNGTLAPNPPRVVRRDDDGSPTPAKPAPDDASGEDTIKLDTKLVNLNVNVSNRSGRALTDLRQQDFTVYEDDVKQEVAHFVPVATPFNLVLLLDLSGSTREKIEAIKETALRFVNVTNPQDKVSVVAFTRGYQVICRPTANRDLLRQRIRDMKRTDGGTAFYEAMWFVMTDVLRDFPGERNAVVVMTDGVDNALSAAYPAPSKISFRQMVDKILESGTLVYPIYLDTEDENYQQQWGETPEVYAKAREQLQQIADASGGVLFMAPRVEELGNIYEKVAAELRTIYSLGYYPASFQRDGKWHKIKVKIGKDDVVTRTRRGYYAK